MNNEELLLDARSREWFVERIYIPTEDQWTALGEGEFPYGWGWFRRELTIQLWSEPIFRLGTWKRGPWKIDAFYKDIHFFGINLCSYHVMTLEKAQKTAMRYVEREAKKLIVESDNLDITVYD